jgi:hypothetical protein
MYSTIPIHWNIKSAPASPGRSCVGPALYVCIWPLGAERTLGVLVLRGGGVVHEEGYSWELKIPQSLHTLTYLFAYFLSYNMPSPIHPSSIPCMQICLHSCMHRWASTSISMSAISDIDICYSDIGDKYVGLKNIIPISEVFRYRHQSSFRYPIFKKKNISFCRFEPTVLGTVCERYNTKLLYLSMYIEISDIRYRIKVYSDIRYNVGLRSLSPISEVPISGSVRYR